MFLIELSQPFSFAVQTRGVIRDQTNQTLIASLSHEQVGYIEFSTWRDHVSVQMIQAEKRGLGVGAALVRELQRLHPDIEIDFGMLTDDGAKLLRNLPSTYTENPEYSEKSQRLTRVKAQLATWQALADQFHAHPTDEGRATLSALGDQWNAFHDEEWNLEQELRHLSPGKRIIKF